MCEALLIKGTMLRPAACAESVPAVYRRGLRRFLTSIGSSEFLDRSSWFFEAASSALAQGALLCFGLRIGGAGRPRAFLQTPVTGIFVPSLLRRSHLFLSSDACDGIGVGLWSWVGKYRYFLKVLIGYRYRGRDRRLTAISMLCFHVALAVGPALRGDFECFSFRMVGCGIVDMPNQQSSPAEENGPNRGC